uniref:Uncharacterized protein n=1 Tax=Fagus sylvatica TaxID=28930 RepID=A0A2N9GCA6_FAGSY
MSNATHMLDEDADVGTTDEIAVGSQLSRPTPKRGSSIELIAKHGNFVAKFKLGAGFGGPMLSLLSNVLAAMSRSDLGSVTKVQILAWKSVVQDLYGGRV